MKRLTIPVAIGAAIVAVALLIGLLVGGGGGRLDPVAKAADSTTAAGSAQIDVSGSIGVQGRVVPLSGKGFLDARNRRGRLAISMVIPGVGQTDFEEIMDGLTFYVKLPGELGKGLRGGKRWIKLDLAAAARAQGIDFDKLLRANPGGAANPGDMLRYLKAVGDSRVVGHETIRGTPTTHYRATVDIDKAVDRIGDRQTEQSLKRLYDSMGVTSVPIEVWIDRSGLVRREAINFTATVGNAGGFSMSMTTDFLRFGVPVKVGAPPADQVYDISALLGRAALPTN
jgi:hypothetical protein